MKCRMVIITLLALLMVEDAYADPASDLALARKFSPILILTEETGGQWGDIRVIKPEPVQIVNTGSSSDLWFEVRALTPNGDMPSGTPSLSFERGTPPTFQTTDLGPGRSFTEAGERIGTGAGRVITPAVTTMELPTEASCDNVYHVTVKAKDHGTPTDFWLVDETAVEQIRALAASGRTASELTETPGGETPDSSLSEKTRVMDNRGTGKRVAYKLVNGALWGMGSGFSTALLLGASGGDPIASGLSAVHGLLYGYMVGAAVGVTRIDPHDDFITTLAGSLVGLVVGRNTFILYPEKWKYGFSWSTWSPVFICPVVGGTIASEWRRNSTSDGIKSKPEQRHISVGLVPYGKSGMSVVARLHF